MSRYDTPLAKYKKQIDGARRRGIPWQLTYEQWLEIWMESGKWPLRGQRVGQYVMARKGDTGPYAVGNVFICLHTENIKDGYRNKPGRCGGHLILGTGKGWFRNHSSKIKPFTAAVRGEYLGSFATQAEAEAAYQAKVAEIKAAA